MDQSVIEFVPLVALGLVVYAFVNLVKQLRARNWNAVLTLVSAWVIGFVAVWLFAETRWGDTIVVGDVALGALNVGELVIVGLVVMAAGSFGYDFKAAVDNTDTAKTPPLVPPTS